MNWRSKQEGTRADKIHTVQLKIAGNLSIRIWNKREHREWFFSSCFHCHYWRSRRKREKITRVCHFFLIAVEAHKVKILINVAFISNLNCINYPPTKTLNLHLFKKKNEKRAQELWPSVTITTKTLKNLLRSIQFHAIIFKF